MANTASPIATRTRRSSRSIRDEVTHPIVDIDGHVIEHVPSLLPHLRESLGADLFTRYCAGEFQGLFVPPSGGTDDRRPSRAPNNGWWGVPTQNTLDRATAMIPGLLHERMDELGIDVTVLYPTLGFGIAGVDLDDLRLGLCTGFNDYFATAYGPYEDRLRLSGVVPMHTPDEALAELDHLHAIGLRVAAFPHGVVRAIESPVREAAACRWPGQTHWLDTFGLDSVYDYDPVWQRCIDLGIAVTFHGGLLMDSLHARSVSNFVANHLGLHASMMSGLARSLLFGGVLHRFPTLRVGLLESGVAWGATMACDLVEHWERRSLEGIGATDPSALDVDSLRDLLDKFGMPSDGVENLATPTGPPLYERDEFRLTGATDAEDLVAQFAEGFVFGAESDDRSVVTAFSSFLPYGAKLGAAFSSDMGHWDVDGLDRVVASARKQVERGLLDEGQFEAFMWTNPHRLLTANDPNFFAGTPAA